MSLDPLKFAVQIEDKVSSQLDAIKQKLATLGDVNIKVKIDNMSELSQQIKTAVGKFEGFNLQLPDFGKIIEGASNVGKEIKNTAKETEAVAKAEANLANAKKAHTEAQKQLNNAVAAQANASNAQKVLDFATLPQDVKNRIAEINKLLASPQGKLSETVISNLKKNFEEQKGYLQELKDIPNDVIAKYRSDYRSYAAQLIEARNKELSVLDKNASDYAAKIAEIKAKYRSAMEQFVDKNVPLSSPNSIPYSAMGEIVKYIEKSSAEYSKAVADRAAAEKELQSLQTIGVQSSMNKAAAEKAVTDATNAHAEAVKRLNSLIVEQQNQQQVKTNYFNLRNEEDNLNAFFAKYTDKFKRMNYEVKSQFMLGSGASGHSPLLDLFKGQEIHRSYVDGFGIFDKQIIAIGKSAEALSDVFGRTRDQAKEMFRTTSSSEFEHMLEMAKAYRREYGRQNITDGDSDKYWRYIISLLEKAVELRRQFEKENPNYVMPSLKKPDIMAAYDADKRIGELKESISKATEVEVNAASELAVAKERLAKIQANEAASAKEIEAARLKVKESEEAEKKATEELAKAKEALAKASKENTTVGSQKWSDVESLNNLISRLKYMRQLTEGLSTEHLANNTGKMTAYYKQMMDLGTIFNTAIADMPKLSKESAAEYVSQIKTLWGELQQAMESKSTGKSGFATSLKEQFDIVGKSFESLTKMGTEQNFLTEVQTQMNLVTATISGSIRNLIRQIDAMKETISDDNFTAYKTRIENTATAMDKLTAAFEKFQGTVGKDEGMKNFMTGLGEVISKIRFQLNSLGEGVGNMSGDQMLKNYRRNLDKVEEGLYRLQEARGKIIEAISIGKGSGMDVSGMENFLTFLQKYENRLLKLKNDEAALAANDLGGVFGRNYKALLSNTSDFVKQANDYQAAATKVVNASIDMESVMSRLTGAIQSGNGRLDVKPLRDLFDEINTLYKKVNAQPNATLAAGLLGNDFAQKISEANRLIAVQADAERNLRRYTAMMEDIIKMEGRIDMAKAISVGLNLPIDQLDAAKKRISDMFDEINKIVTDKTRLGDTQLFGAKQFEYKRMTADTKELTVAQEKLNKETQKAIDKSNAEANKKAAAAAKEAAAETNKWAESQRQAAIQADALTRKVDKWSQIADRGAKLGVDTSELQNAIKIMNVYVQLLNQMSNGVRWSKTTSEIVSTPGFIIGSRDAEAAAKTVTQQSNELERNANSKNKAAKASNELTLQEQRLASEMEKVAQSAKGQSQTLSELKSMAQQYLSVYGAQQFLSNIIEIGGQLENQRMSIASILGDAAQANTLFEQIQSLAVKSPFGVVELDQYTKQLSAFGFQYNELYDMTKRLADISAGAGTDVGRLALALGHVRAEGALTGYTLRQFHMNNIPMVQKLSDMLSAREGRLVSTQDIRKRVSNKQIGYEDVISVIKGLTDEGGMFYNMQEAISQSTKSKWKNLKDAMDIMYGKMAESDFVGGGLKDLAGFLTDLTKRWQEIMAVMTAVGTTFVASKLAVWAYNTALGQNAALTFKAMTAAKKQEAANLSLAKTYRTVSAKEEALNKSRNLQAITLTKLAINQGKLSAEELSRAVAMGKLSKEEARAAVRASTLSAVEKGQMLVMVKNTQILTRYQRVMLGVTSTLFSFGAALKAVFFNPMTYIMVAISAITELWMRNKAEMDAMKEAADNVALKGKEGIKNMKEFFNSNSIQATTTVVKRKKGDDKAKQETIQKNVTGEIENYRNFKVTFPVFAELDKASVKSVMDNAEQFIREYSSTPNKMLNNAFALKDDGSVPKLEEQYKSLEKSINTVALAYTRLKNEVSPIVEYALDATDSGWFNDSLITNINDYSKDYKKYSDSMTELMKKHYEYAEAAMKAAEADNAFGAAVKAKNKEMYKSENRYMTLSEKVRMLVENQGKFANAYSLFDNKMSWDDGSNIETWSEVVLRLHNMRISFSEMNSDLDVFVSNVKAKLTEVGWDFTKLSEDQRMALSLMLADVVAKANDSTDDIKNKVTALAKQKFNIDLDVKEQELIGKISTIKQELEALCGKKWVLDIGVNTDKMADIIKSTDTKYQEALGTISRAFESGKSLLKNLGVKKGKKVDMSTISSPLSETQRQFIQEYNDAVDLKESSDKFYKKLGIEPPEEKNKNKNKNTKAYKDEFAKRWDERIRIMKEAYDWYEKWRKEYGKDTAFDKVNSRYQDIFKEWKTDKALPMDFDVKQVADYAKYVRQIKDDALKRYQAQKNDKTKNNGQEALRVFRQAVSLLTDFDWDEIQRKTEEYASTVKRAIDDMSRRWENYKNVLDSTGNSGLAAQLSGLTQEDINDVNMANNLRRYIISSMASNVDFDRVFGMSEKDIQNYVAEELVGTPLQNNGESDAQYRDRLESYKEKVRGIVEALKEWQSLQRNVLTDAALTYAKIIGSAQDFSTLIKKNNKEYDDGIKALNVLKTHGQISQEQYDNAKEMLESKRDYDNGKLSGTYLNLMNNSTAMTKVQFDNALASQLQRLNTLFKTGGISVENYIKEFEGLRKIQDEFSAKGIFGNANALTSIIGGGLPGLKSYYEKERSRRETELLAQGKTEAGFGNDTEWSKADEWVKKLNRLADAASDTAAVFDVVSGVLDGFQKAFQSMSDMFDSYGNETMANLFSDIADGIGAVTSIFSPINNVMQNAMNGNVGGLVSSLISAPFEMIASPITAFNKLHDKGIERKIEELKKEVSKIENNTALILQSRKRTLGYDFGSVSRWYASMYANAASNGDVASRDMYEYYSRGGGGSGYAQQLANLQKERENYMEQLSKQEEKKKKSNTDIEETKKKISELDDQIYNFSQDLANELWGIDVKSWAQQLSDALATAFENGKSMAEAYGDTVRGILQSIASKMIQVSLMEPMFQTLQDKLFGSKNADGTYSGGVMDMNDIEGSAQRATDVIADFFGNGGEGQKIIYASQQYLNALEKGLNDAGLSLFNSETETLGNGIRGTSEETSNLLAAYVNAMRQDVSIIRIMNEQFIGEYWSGYIQQVTGIQNSLVNIDRNVALIYALMSENGALYSTISSINSRLERFSTGIESISVK